MISQLDFLERGLLREIEPVIRVAVRGSEYEAEIVPEDQRKSREADAEPKGAMERPEGLASSTQKLQK